MASKNSEPGSWRSYRRRRQSLLAGVIFGVLGIGTGYLLGASHAVMLVFGCGWGLAVVVLGVLFFSFPCPACGHEWFGIKASPLAHSLIERQLEMLAQKLCQNCGLPKFMEPDGWDPEELHDVSEGFADAPRRH